MSRDALRADRDLGHHHPFGPGAETRGRQGGDCAGQGDRGVAGDAVTPSRLLIVPGLGDSGPAHWQTWLQHGDRHALRVRQRDWTSPDLDRWAARIASTLERAGPGPWIA